MAIPVDYPRLRTILRDGDLAFNPIFGRRDVAGILGRGTRPSVPGLTLGSSRAAVRLPMIPITRCEHGGKERTD